MNPRRRASAGLGLALAAMAALLVGCAMPQSVPMGSSRDEVQARLGAPTGQYPLADGTRLQYSGQPAGQWVYNIDLDRQGRVRSVTQALDESRFASEIVVDRSDRAQLLAALGRPALIERTARFDGEVWTWRYDNVGLWRRLHVYVDPTGVARKVETTDELREVEPRLVP